MARCYFLKRSLNMVQKFLDENKFSLLNGDRDEMRIRNNPVKPRSLYNILSIIMVEMI